MIISNFGDFMSINLQDALKDIVQHTYALGTIDLVKIVGTDKTTSISAIADDRSVIVEASFKEAVPEFVGTFGMPSLGKLKTILNIPMYKDDAIISMNYQDGAGGVKTVAGIHFENNVGDFKNDYRFMSADVVNDKLKAIKFRGVRWDVEFTPSLANIQRLKFQSSANSEETAFTAKTDGTNLRFYFGDHSSHTGNFVFQSDITGKLSRAWSWPVSAVLGILDLSGDKVFHISDEGAAQITVDTGIAIYKYILPATMK